MINHPRSPKRTVGHIIGMQPKNEPEPEKTNAISPNLPVWRHLVDIAKSKAKAWLDGNQIVETDTGVPLPKIARGFYIHESDVYFVLGACRDQSFWNVTSVGERMPMVFYVSLSTGQLYVRSVADFKAIVTWPQGIEAARFVHRRLFSNDPLVLIAPIKFSVKHHLNETKWWHKSVYESKMSEACATAFGCKGFDGGHVRKFMFGQVMVTVKVVFRKEGHFDIELRNVPIEMMDLYDVAVRSLEDVSADISEKERQLEEDEMVRHQKEYEKIVGNK